MTFIEETSRTISVSIFCTSPKADVTSEKAPNNSNLSLDVIYSPVKESYKFESLFRTDPPILTWISEAQYKEELNLLKLKNEQEKIELKKKRLKIQKQKAEREKLGIPTDVGGIRKIGSGVIMEEDDEELPNREEEIKALDREFKRNAL